MNQKLPSLSGLSFERLKTFCLVAEEGSIVGAARNDLTRQSQYSRQIKELEEALGAKLFRRDGKKFTLTESGQKLALVTQSYFGAIQEVRADAEHALSTISLGAAESVFRWIVLPRLSEILSNNPGMRFEFHTARTHDSVARVKDGVYDLAIVRSDAVEEPLAGVPVGAMDYCWVVPRSRLPGKAAAGIHLVAEVPIALICGDGKLARGIMSVAEQNNLRISIRLLADNFGLIIEALRNAELAAVLPVPAMEKLSKERFAVVELKGMESLRRELSLVYHAKTAQIRESIRQTSARLQKALVR